MEAMAWPVDGPASEGGMHANTWRTPAASASTSGSGATNVATMPEVVASAAPVSASGSGATNAATTPEVVAAISSATGSSEAGTKVTFSDVITSCISVATRDTATGATSGVGCSSCGGIAGAGTRSWADQLLPSGTDFGLEPPMSTLVDFLKKISFKTHYKIKSSHNQYLSDPLVLTLWTSLCSKRASLPSAWA
uniref:Uncharacterized protein n=1 Tax=Setaria viridis TaxID=4556 RepID=A0A4U6VQ47_SETVI|nr:hypothetical protein SEVIR_2G095320v2 [Setaria viridis]